MEPADDVTLLRGGAALSSFYLRGPKLPLNILEESCSSLMLGTFPSLFGAHYSSL